MQYEIRPITPDQFPDFLRREGVAFSSHVNDDEIEAQRSLFEFDRSLAVFDGNQIVGTAGAASFRLTLPGFTTTPIAGTTWVSVFPTHRRQGLLRRLMARHLDDVHAHGEPLAMLYASESLLYGRFGYGLAADQLGFTIERGHAAFARPHHASGHCSLLEPDEAAAVLPQLYEQACRVQPGAVARDKAWWDICFRDLPSWRDDASARFYLTYSSASGAEGYATYRVKRSWEGGIPEHTLLLLDLFALTVEARAALWHFVLNLDLVQTIRASNRPVDEPLRRLLADPRRLHVEYLNDGLWVRLVDIPAALSARRYATSGRLVLKVVDTFRPQSSGCYKLEGGPDGASCNPSDAAPDLVMHVEELSAAYLGGVRFGLLARAGRITELVPGALSRADALFASDPAPWGTTPF